MARATDVLDAPRRLPRHEHETSVSRKMERVAGALAVLAGPLLHASTPSLPSRRRKHRRRP